MERRRINEHNTRIPGGITQVNAVDGMSVSDGVRLGVIDREGDDDADNLRECTDIRVDNDFASMRAADAPVGLRPCSLPLYPREVHPKDRPFSGPRLEGDEHTAPDGNGSIGSETTDNAKSRHAQFNAINSTFHWESNEGIDPWSNDSGEVQNVKGTSVKSDKTGPTVHWESEAPDQPWSNLWSAQDTDNYIRDSYSAAPPPSALTGKILQYLEDSMLEAVYGDSLSGCRTRRYEPKWPMDSAEIQTPLHQPISQGDAHSTFERLFRPLRCWYRLSEITNTAEEAHSKQKQIEAILAKHRQSRAAKRPSEKCSGNILLYGNFPDAAIEANVWSLINLGHVAIQRKAWDVADRSISRASILASKLDYEPLCSKCWYWRGRIADGLGDRRSAADCFLEAMNCVGIYQEGELLSKVVVEYKDDLLKSLDERDANQGRDDWSRQVRRAILGTDGWFQPLRDLFPRPLSSSTSTIPATVSTKG